MTIKTASFLAVTCVVLFFLIIPGSISAQNNDVPVKVNGKKFYRHIVAKGETIYGIAEKFDEQAKDIVFENPNAIDGIHPGDTLMIPVIAKSADTSSAKGNYTYHKVVGKETLYSLAKKYNTTISILDSLNPGLAKEGLKAGQNLRIPAAPGPAESAMNKPPGKKYTTANDTIQPARQKQENTGKNQAQAYKALIDGQAPVAPAHSGIDRDTSKPFAVYKDTGRKLNRYNVAVIMPFASGSADTLSLNRLLEGTAQIPLVSQISIDFYHGLMLAFDSLAKKGFKANLHIFNISSGSDSSSYAIDSILKNPEILQMNLIIGPPYPSNFKRVARFAGIHRIAIVSPLSAESNVLKNNPWTSKITPSFRTETEMEADYIASHYSRDNIIIVHNRNANDEYYEAFKNRFHKSDSALGNKDTLRSAESVGFVSGFGSIINGNGANVIVMPYQGAPFVAKFVNELANSKYARNDSLILFGMQNWGNNDALEPANLDTLNFHFPSNEFVNYKDSATKIFIAKYRNSYFSEPSYFSYQGYDAAMFYGNLLYNYGTDIQEHLGDTKYRGLQTSFNMSRINPTTGFENKTTYILGYKNYTELLDYR